MDQGTQDEMGIVGWVIAAQAGDLRAFDALARRYRAAAVSIARPIVSSRDTAEDVVQDALIAAYAALPRLEFPEAFPGWLAAIVRNRARKMASGERRLPSALDEVLLANLPAITQPPLTRLIADEVTCALQDLSLELREIAERYYLDHWSVQEIVEFTGLPSTTVKWRLHAARQSLRQSLPGYEDRYA